MSKFRELATIVKDSVKPEEFSPNDKYVAYEHILPGTLKISEFGSLDGVTSPKTRFRSGDTIYGRLRPYFRKVAFAKDFDGVCSSDFWVLRPVGSTDPKFLFYVTALEDFSRLAMSSNTGTRMPRASWDAVREFEVPEFSVVEQRAIAATLGALDDKIESNRRAVNLIEELIVSEFMELRSGANGDTGRLDSFFPISIGRTPPRKESQWFTHPGPESISWASIKDMGSATTFLTATSEALTQEALVTHRVPKVNEGDILVSFKLTVGRVAIASHDMCTNEAIACLHVTDPRLREYGYAFMKTFDFNTLGSTSSIATAVNSKSIKSIPFFCPDQNSLNSFHSRTKPLFEMSKQLEQQTALVRSLRDTLLPELMSGRIRVPEAQKAVEEAIDTDLILDVRDPS